MEDRELLGLAAEAAGLKIEWKTGTCKGGAYCAPFVNGEPWRPLVADNADALRLMAGLSMGVAVWDQDYMHASPHVAARVDMPDGHEIELIEPIVSNAEASTCRAIVRAAAQVALARRGV
ncbi:MAG: hypothetical protein RL758_185 [Pseudomonadota bacterium]|jgi:hypothetical protein